MIHSKDFFIVISASELAIFSGAEDKDIHPNPFLVHAFSALSLDICPLAFYFYYYDVVQSGKGDVYLFNQAVNGDGVFAINLYRDEYDQQDGITLAFRSEDYSSQLRTALRNFFDGSAAQFIYQESNLCPRVSEMMQKSNYPKRIEQSGYLQQLHEDTLPV